jgi:PadR family transcriptional regulator PadR
MKGDRLGEFEELILLTILALDVPAYAVPIQQSIAKTSRRDVVMGAVYGALDRLEAKGFVRSAMGEPTSERGGKPKRIFHLTAPGERVLREARRQRDGIWKTIEGKR